MWQEDSSLCLLKLCPYDNQSPQGESTANSQNVIYIKNTSDNEWRQIWYSYPILFYFYTPVIRLFLCVVLVLIIFHFGLLYHNFSFLFFRHLGIEWIIITVLLQIYRQLVHLIMVQDNKNNFTYYNEITKVPWTNIPASCPLHWPAYSGVDYIERNLEFTLLKGLPKIRVKLRKVLN